MAGFRRVFGDIRHGYYGRSHFVTGTINEIQSQQLSSPYARCFIPTTPNPPPGWYAIYSEDETVNISMSIEDAFKLIISGSICRPSLIPLVSPRAETAGSSPREFNISLTPMQPRCAWASSFKP